MSRSSRRSNGAMRNGQRSSYENIRSDSPLRSELHTRTSSYKVERSVGVPYTKREKTPLELTLARNLVFPRGFMPGPARCAKAPSVVRGDNWVLQDILVRRRQADFAATAQFEACVQRPVRVVQHRSRQEDQCGLPVLQDSLRNLRLGNRADRRGRQFSLFEDPLCKRNLIGRAGVITDTRRDTAGTAIKQVHAQRLQPFRQFNGLVNVPTAANPVRGRDPHCQRQRYGPDRSDAFRRFYRKSNPVLERTAVAIGTLIGNRRKKTVSQITVGAMQLDQTEPGSTNGSRAQVNQMPIRCKSILRPILAHRGDPDAVAQADLPQFPRCKKQWFHKIIFRFTIRFSHFPQLSSATLKTVV